ncbi:MAG: replication-associated recombination protein A [Phycisphaerales bacterium]
MADLWLEQRERAIASAAPLPVRMRPRQLDEVIGQSHILGPGRLLRRMIAARSLTSLILFGPPGTGKTTLAECIAAELGWHFERENASVVGVARIREIIAEARQRLGAGTSDRAAPARRTLLFLDEIHRFSKSQQDVLLGDVERGIVTLIGATTENPLFAVNAALVSRSTLLRLEPLTEQDILTLLRRAVTDPERGFGARQVRVDDDALELWATLCDGDARRALIALEIAVLSSRPTPDSSGPPFIHIDRAVALDSIQRKAAVYADDEHYDLASALIKSLRGSDPDAALYWMARMLEGGEDPRFIARRLAILASEDIGNADPRAISVAAAAWELVERIGLPEARITLAQCCTYLALAPKSNASCAAVEAALELVREGRTVPVPMHIKDGNVRRAADKAASAPAGGPRETYAYSHEQGAASDTLGRIGTQDYLGIPARLYHPTDHGEEKLLKARLEEALRVRSAREAPPPA